MLPWRLSVGGRWARQCLTIRSYVFKHLPPITYHQDIRTLSVLRWSFITSLRYSMCSFVFACLSPDMPRSPLLETGGKWRSRCVKPSWNKRRRSEWEETPYSHLLEWQRRARFLGFLDMFKTSYLNLFKFSSKMTPWAGWSSKLTNSIQLLCFHPSQIVTHRAWFQFWRPALAWPTTISLRLEGHPRFWRKNGFM